ncbi:AraC family transcriptional regulator, partial [Blautia wexlerae]|nr:AraC family transcriptional regulator [Blautia wexlerae]
MRNLKQLSKANDRRRQAFLIQFFAERAGFHEKQSAQYKKNAKYAYSTCVYVELAIQYIKDMYQKGIGIS